MPLSDREEHIGILTCSNTIRRRQKAILITLVLLALTLIVYWQVQHHEFVYYDDQDYVMENVHVQKGLTWENLKWAFTATECGFYQPLTWLTYMADFELYRFKAGGYHWTNLLFHLANTVLLFWVLSLMTGSLWRGGFVAALFALHPLHVESVAWIAERKDVVSGFFWILTMGAYLYYTKNPGIGRYLAVLTLFTLGLMAKPMAITLPFVLLLLDLWPLRRFGMINILEKGNKKRAIRLILEKIPLFMISIVFIAVSFVTVKEADALRTLDQFPFFVRVANAFISYGAYIRKMFLPWDLAMPYSHLGLMNYWLTALSAALILLISVIVFRRIKTQPYLSVGWLWYLGTLVPVIGLVQIGAHAMGDRYTYLPLVGLFIMLVWGVSDLVLPLRNGRYALAFLGSILLVSMVFLSYRQVGYWKDTVTLSRHAITVTEGNYLAHNNLGGALDREGQADEAIRHYGEAIRIMPSYADAWYNIGTTLAKQGKSVQAIPFYEKALQYQPEFVEAYNNLGTALFKQGRYDESIVYFRQALQIDPGYAEAYNNIGVVLAGKEQYAESVKYFQEALRIKPDYVMARKNLSSAQKRLGIR